jgi:GxxExxY protein
MDLKEVTGSIIGAAIEVHRSLGPGLLESSYEECLCRELSLRKIPFERQKELPIEYKGVRLDCIRCRSRHPLRLPAIYLAGLCGEL